MNLVKHLEKRQKQRNVRKKEHEFLIKKKGSYLPQIEENKLVVRVRQGKSMTFK